ncbi:MAG: tetratricopeptide repeat protein [Candidatus Odinarchaeota archaeon]
MIFDEKEFHLSELLKYQVLDTEGKVVGQINDILLSTDDLSIEKIIISQDLYNFKSGFINTGDIVSENKEKRIFTIYYARSEVQNARLQDFWDISEDKHVVLFSKLRNLPIIDIDGKEHPKKVIDIFTRGSEGKDPKMLILEEGYIIAGNFIRTLSTMTGIWLTVSDDHLETIKNIPEESYQSILIDPEREIEALDINNPDWSVINKLIVFGYVEPVEQLLNDWQASDELSEKEEPALYYYYGKTCLEWGELQKAIQMFKTAIDLANQKDFDDPLLLGRACTQLGRALITTGDFDEAEVILDRAAFTLLTDVKNSLYRSIAFNWLGRLFWLRGFKQKALKVFEQALEISELFNSPKTKAYSLENLALYYRDEGQLEKAVETLQEAIMVLKGDYPGTTASIMGNLAMTYYEMGMLGKALEIHFDTLVMREKIGNPIDIADSVMNIARVEAATGSFSTTSSILSYFPTGYTEHSLLKAYRNIIEGLLAKVTKKWEIAAAHFKEALCPNLAFNYQVWVYEYIGECMIMRWKESTDEKTLSELKHRLSRARELTKKNNLYSYICKCDIILALLAVYCKEFNKAESYYRESLEIAQNQNLTVHVRISKKGLEALPVLVAKLESSDFEEIEFTKQKTIMEMLLYGRHLRLVHLF